MIFQTPIQPAARALDEVLRLFDPREAHDGDDAPDARWGVFSYHASFTDLWGTLFSQLPQRVAIVWGRDAATQSVAEVNLESSVTPIAWAVSALKARHDMQVLILDTTPAQHRKESRLYRFVEAIQPQRMPWLRLVPLNELGHFLTNSLPPIANDESSRGNSDSGSEFLDMLSHQIQIELTESGNEGNHHAIQNIVGPQVLLGDAERGGVSSGERALLTLFRTVGLVKESGRDLEETQSTPEKWPIRYWGDKTIRLLLVDDQHHIGWKTWIESAIHQECKQRVKVVSAKKPHFLLEAVKRALDGRLPDSGSSAARSDGRFKLEFGDPVEDGMNAAALSGEPQTILLLDLRLFALEAHTDAEAEFLQEQLLPLCAHFVETGDSKRGFAWRGFSPDELDRVHRWCSDTDRERNSPAHLLSLTFLPRLIALADMSVPVVIFSSTGRREITDLLKLYGNVVTDFEKPRFLGRNAHDAVIETRAKFRDALEKARAILLARGQCQAVSRFVPLKQQKPSLAYDYYLELFLDETEGCAVPASNPEKKVITSISVGGCFALFVHQDSAKREADRFDDWLVQKGVRYFDSRGIGLTTSQPLANKGKTNLAPILEGWRRIPCAPKELGVVRLTVDLRNAESDGSGSNLLEADNRFHVALRTLIELVLAESMPALSEYSGLEHEYMVVSIYAGTRMLCLNEDQKLERRVAMSDYGMEPHVNNEWAFYSLRRSDIFPIVHEVLENRGITRRPRRLLAVKMPYHDAQYVQTPEYFICRTCDEVVQDSRRIDTPKLGCNCRGPFKSDFAPDYRALHYISDEILTQFPEARAAHQYDSLIKRSKANGECLVVPGEFDDSLDEALRESIVASRALDLNDLVTAIEKIHPSPWPSDGSKPKASYWIARRIASRLHDLKGPEFVMLTNRLAERDRTAEEERSSVHA